MFGLGFWEILIVLLAVIVLVNPKEMPKIARKVGNWYRKIRNFRDEVDREVKRFDNEFRRGDNKEEDTNDRNN